MTRTDRGIKRDRLLSLMRASAALHDALFEQAWEATRLLESGTADPAAMTRLRQLRLAWVEGRADLSMRVDATCATCQHEDAAMSTDPISVWLFRDAPADLRAMSDHGGDEDWLALIPPDLADGYIGWMEEATPFGYFRVSEHDVPGKPGWKVRIGAHA